MKDDRPERTRSERFLKERKRTRHFFNLTAVIYPLIERHLVPRYEDALARLDLPPALTVLDVATGSGILAAAFARRGHPVTGLDFSRRLLKRARKKFPAIDFGAFDLVELAKMPAKSYGIVSCGYLLHGLSPEFRATILKNIARIARHYVVVFDYCCDGGWFVRLIERMEGPHYPRFIATGREAEFAGAGLRIERSFRTSPFGDAWLCRPE
ncbi:MAG: class I SAM-dependent methyltransferase [Acidobacteria bacterium]|jgi:2-polyprenyl-3-methyl-5-hydroxy-6-metoxy-1,4-benzoquinol methylase|nr:class I SAM-dependent methyltransferase [Acidobacteriota bacterium]